MGGMGMGISQAIQVVGGTLSGVAAMTTARKQAKQLRRIGRQEAEEQRQENERVLGAQTAAYGASGVSATSGSALDVLSDSVAQGELIALKKKYARYSEAAQLKSQGDRAAFASFFMTSASVLGSSSSTAPQTTAQTTGRGATRNRPSPITSSWTSGGLQGGRKPNW
jgi:hypothetical protein